MQGLVGKKPDGDPPVETFLDEAIASIGDDGELSASLVAAMSVNQVTPVLDVLKVRVSSPGTAACVGGQQPGKGRTRLCTKHSWVPPARRYCQS